MNTEGPEERQTGGTRAQPTFCTAPWWPKTAQIRSEPIGDTSLEKQIHKKKFILEKHMNPYPLIMALLEINLGGKHFNNDVHSCTPLL